MRSFADSVVALRNSPLRQGLVAAIENHSGKEADTIIRASVTCESFAPGHAVGSGGPEKARA
jgi:hypothetical protein